MKKAYLLHLVVVAMGMATTFGQSAPAAPAGSTIVHLKNGTNLASSSVRRIGPEISVSVMLGTAGRSETRYPVAAVSKIDFPKPKALRIAEESLAANNPQVALSAVSPVVLQQSAFQDIPGNWWVDAQVLNVKALVALERYKEAELAIEALSKRADPEDLRTAKLQMALGWTKKGDGAKALPLFEDAISESSNAATVATAWIGRGNAFMASKDYDAALLSFLRVPIFYPNEKQAQPPALLGSARAYLRLNEFQKARDLLNEVVASYPNSPAAVEAKAELKSLDGAASPATSS